MSFSAFITGFANKTTEYIDRRKDQADDYFEQQMERASTVGVEALSKRRENYKNVRQVANNLITQAGMPEDVVRGLANDGIEALTQAYDIYSKSAQRGVTLDEDFWRDAYTFSKEVSTDMPLDEFLKRSSGLYADNLEVVQKEGGDPFSAFMSAGLGLNAMETARDRLATVEVADGFSARDLLEMGRRPMNQGPLGDLDRTTNLNAIYDRTRGTASVEDLEATERRSEVMRFSSEAQELAEEAVKTQQQSEGFDPANADLDSTRKGAFEELAIRYYEAYGMPPEWVQRNNPAVWNALPEDYKNSLMGGSPNEPEEDQPPVEDPIGLPAAETVSTPEEATPVTPPAETTPEPSVVIEGGGDMPPTRSLKENEEISRGTHPEAPVRFYHDGEELRYVGKTSDGYVIYENSKGVRTPPMNPDVIPVNSYNINDMPAQATSQDSVPQESRERLEPSMSSDKRPQTRPEGLRSRPEKNPARRVRVGDRRYIFTGEYDQETHSWQYQDVITGQKVLIPVGG